MITALQAPLFFGLIAAFVTTVGLLAVAQRADWSARHASLFGLAAGGMLITLTLLHIAPQAFARTSQAPAWLLGGFLGGLVLSQLMRAIPGAAPQPGNVPARVSDAVTPVIAIALHSFIDGIIYSVTFAASFQSGVYAALALILHEFPEGVIAFAILRAGGVSNRMSFFWAFMAAAFTTPLGVIVSVPVMYVISQDTLGQLFALSAGLLFFVATGPLLAPVRDVAPLRGVAAIAAGVALAFIIVQLPVHDHDHEHGLEAPGSDPHHDAGPDHGPIDVHDRAGRTRETPHSA